MHNNVNVLHQLDEIGNSIQNIILHLQQVEARNTLTHELQTLRTQFVNTIGQGGNINEFQAQLTQAQNLYQQYGSAQGVPPAALGAIRELIANLTQLVNHLRNQ
uniref:Uncharacterized protein n=1 Tax=Meloidogyne enterolobii TaxID=390850 RepID=A0A6V7XYX4_MELEN|nr:unnamed protein product [Meloidogyne enterolobii]